MEREREESIRMLLELSVLDGWERSESWGHCFVKGVMKNSPVFILNLWKPVCHL